MDKFDVAIAQALDYLKLDIILKEFQMNVVHNYMSGRDVFCTAGTGAGKSMTYILAPIVQDIFEGLCPQVEDGIITLKSTVIIVQPLKALMHEQMQKLENFGLKANYLGEDGSKDRMTANYIITAPESIKTEIFQKIIETGKVKYVFIDESHCIQTLGHGKGKKHDQPFRACYSELGNLRSQIPNVPFISLTATATALIKATILTDLHMNNCTFVAQDADRVNIRYSLIKLKSDVYDAMDWLLQELKVNGEFTQRVLVFCYSKEVCVNLFEHFKAELGSDMYSVMDNEPQDDRSSLIGMFHRGTREEQKKTALTAFTSHTSKIRVLFCTASFGMGVDVNNCHLAVHIGPPTLIDELLQQTGRIGRDGHQSHAIVVLYKNCMVGRCLEDEMKAYITIALYVAEQY